MNDIPLNRLDKISPLPSLEEFRQFHAHIPLAGDPPNQILTLPDDLFIYLVATLRNNPTSPPTCSLQDWDTVLRFLRPHGIIPLIASNLISWPENCHPPKETMAFLSKILLFGGARGLYHENQIRRVTTALEDAGIPVLLLKGHALARTVYPDPALRHSADIDLLVKPEDVPKCEPAFARLGYTCSLHTFRISSYEHHHQIFYPPNNKGSPIELHWMTDLGYRMFSPGWLNDAFDRKMLVTSGNLSCFTLDSTDHFTFLAFHDIFQHSSLRLDWICDIALLMHTLTVRGDWEKIRSTCVQNHIRIPVELALTVGSLWFAEDIPQEYRDFSTWPAPSERELRLWKFAKLRQVNLLSGIYLALQGMPGFSEKLKYGFRFILPPTELMQKYRSSCSHADIPLAHFRRWSRILKYL
ncbi:MAG: nucleotidyltransferase family protein [Methanoregula sp.]|nr:nucleotidyltransferase family protein [Methanoregula sp.]